MGPSSFKSKMPDGSLSFFHVHIGPEDFSFFIQEEGDTVEFRFVAHDVEIARPIFDREFLVAHDQDDWLPLVLLIDEGARERERDSVVVEGERALGRATRQIGSGGKHGAGEGK